MGVFLLGKIASLLLSRDAMNLLQRGLWVGSAEISLAWAVRPI